MAKLNRSQIIGVAVALILFGGFLWFESPIVDDLKSITGDTQGAGVGDERNSKSALVINDLALGEGRVASPGDRVAVHYVGRLENGQKFDSSYDRGLPFEFDLGAGFVISGFDNGIVGMKVGGKRILTIPPNQAYGDQDNGPIPANSTLVFEVELVEIK